MSDTLDTVLSTLKDLLTDALSALASGSTSKLIAVLSLLATKAILAYHKAAGIEITAESVLALLPADIPLVTPTDGVTTEE